MKPFSNHKFYHLAMTIFALLFGCTACNPSGHIQLATPSPTSQYAHFAPPPESVFKLQFDYPTEWRNRYFQGDDWAQFNIYDPTQVPSNADLTPPVYSDNSIVISVVLGDNLKESVEFMLNANRNMDPEGKVMPDCENCISPFKFEVVDKIILEDQATEIAGYPAHRISTQSTIVTGETRNTFFTGSVYIIGDDRLYTFDLSMLADEKDGPFGKGFEYMISTIRPYP